MMRFLVILLIVFIAFDLPANAYPNQRLQECMLGVKQSSILVGVPQEEVNDWCDCVLQLILDEGKDDKASASYCGHKYFK